MIVTRHINNKYGILNSEGKWVVAPIYDELGKFDKFGLAKATVKNKYGWIDVNGNWKIEPKFDIRTFLKDYDDDYYTMQFLTEDTFRYAKEDLLNVYFYDEIPNNVKSAFDKDLDGEFKENLEYLLFYDDSLDNSGTDGIAIVKKEDDYFLIFSEHRQKPVIFFLYSRFEMWEITNFSSDEYGYLFTVTTEIDAKVINGDCYSVMDNHEALKHLIDVKNIEHVREKQYFFHFYNTRFLRLLIELCERIENEMNE